MNRIPVAGPWVTQHEIDAITDAAKNAWYSGAGGYVDRFETAFAAYVGRRYAVTLPSCTSGIHLALVALGIGPGDEVIVPESTWIASAAAVNYVGATPVFADVDPTTWCLDARDLERRISPRTKAVIPVDLYGGMPEWDNILNSAAKHGIAVIEDAAEAIGSEYHDRLAGAFGLASVFSFHGSKTLTTGEGGMLVTDDDKLHHRIMTLRDHGRPPGDRMFRNKEVAFKYKMSPLLAAFGLAQLERIGELVSKKRQIFNWYNRRLSDISGLALNAEPAGTVNSYWMTTVLIEDESGRQTEDWMRVLEEDGIDTRPFFHPLSSLDAYSRDIDTSRAKAENKTAYRLASCGINLPSALSLDEVDVGNVCDALLNRLN